MSEKWISFDCFGTLVDWHGGFRAILTGAGARDPAAIIAAYHKNERLVEAEPYVPYRDVTARALERAMDETGTRGSVPATVLADHWDELPVFGDTEEALRRLRSDGWSLAVLTNCDDDLFARTAQRFEDPFDRVITAQMVRSYKPALGHFKTFRETIGDAVWVHAACSWFHDIVPARTMGVPRVWIDRDRTGDEPAIATAVLPDLIELPAIARHLTAS